MASQVGQFFAGTPSRIEQIQRFNPQQQQSLMQLLQMGQQGLQNPYQGFDAIANSARRGFQQQTAPSLAERFTSQTNGALSSGALGSQLAGAGVDLESNLAALQSQYGQQQQNHFANLLGMGLTPQYENYALGGEGGALQELLPVLGKVGMRALGAGLSGGWSEVLPAIAEILKMLASQNKG